MRVAVLANLDSEKIILGVVNQAAVLAKQPIELLAIGRVQSVLTLAAVSVILRHPVMNRLLSGLELAPQFFDRSPIAMELQQLVASSQN